MAQDYLRYCIRYLSAPKSDELDPLNKDTLLGLWKKIAKIPVTYYLLANVLESTVEKLVNQYLSEIHRMPEKRVFYKEQFAMGETP